MFTSEHKQIFEIYSCFYQNRGEYLNLLLFLLKNRGKSLNVVLVLIWKIVANLGFIAVFLKNRGKSSRFTDVH